MIGKSIIQIVRRTAGSLARVSANHQVATFYSYPPSATANSTAPAPKLSDWDRALTEAEHIVDYPTSFLNLQWLLRNEIADVSCYLGKLADTNHPLLKTAKQLIYNGTTTIQTLGLIVLLISKAAGRASTVPHKEQDIRAGVLHSQRTLATTTGQICLLNLVHKSLVNFQCSSEAGKDACSRNGDIFGNKLSLLWGDYLISRIFINLASMRNQKVHALIFSVIRDHSESQFIGDRDEQNNPLPSKPGIATSNTTTTVDKDFVDPDCMIPLAKVMGIPEKEWECRNVLNASSLWGKSCQGALILAGQSKELQKQAYLFGKHLSLAWQACLDTEPFQNSTLPLVSAPVLFHLEYDPSLYDEIEKGKVSVENINYEKVHKAILSGPGVEKTKELQKNHTTAAMEILEKFPPSDARTALQNIILAIKDL